MAGSAEAFRPLAHDLYADESLVQERRSRSGIREVAVGADREDQDRGVRARLDLDQGASGRDGRSKKNGPQAIGKSRGGWNTKVHLVAANARTAITFALSPGHAHDAPEGRALLAELGPMPEGLPLLMDRASRGTKQGNWCSAWACSPSFRQSPTASSPGNTTALSTRSATKSSGSFGDSRASAESSPASRNSMSSSLASSPSPSSQKPL